MSRHVLEVNLECALGVNPRGPLGLVSDFGPVRHEWLCIAPKITETLKLYHDNNGHSRQGGNVIPKINNSVKKCISWKK